MSKSHLSKNFLGEQYLQIQTQIPKKMGYFLLKNKNKIENHQSSNPWFQICRALSGHHLCDYYGTVCNSNCSFTEILLILCFQTCEKIYQSDIKTKLFKLVSWFCFLLAWNLVSLRYNSDPDLSRQTFDKYIVAVDNYFLFPANLMIQIPFFALFPLFSRFKWPKTRNNRKETGIFIPMYQI